MSDLSTIPAQELHEDRVASVADIALCRLALSAGVTHHADGLPVAERLSTNERIIAVIDSELRRRGMQPTRPD